MQIGKLIRTKMKMTKRKDNVVVGRMKKYSKGFGFVIIDNDRTAKIGRASCRERV